MGQDDSSLAVRWFGRSGHRLRQHWGVIWLAHLVDGVLGRVSDAQAPLHLYPGCLLSEVDCHLRTRPLSTGMRRYFLLVGNGVDSVCLHWQGDHKPGLGDLFLSPCGSLFHTHTLGQTFAWFHHLPG